MKVALVTTWGQHCGMSYFSKYLSEALSKLVKVKICRVDPSFTREEFADAASSCDGDLVHIEHEWGIYKGHEDLFLDILAKKRLPVVLTAHGGGYQRFFGKVAKIAVPNKTQRGSYGDSVIPILPHGVTVYPKVEREKARAELGITKSKVVTQWGFILPHKCYELVLHGLRDEGDVCVLVAGSEERDFEYWLKLQRLIKEWHVKAEIIKTGFLEESKIPLVFGATDLCAFPYLTGVDSGCLRYALGSKVLSLSSPAPFIQEIFKEYGVPYISRDPWDQNFHVALKQLLEKKDLADFEARCARFAEELSWENVAKKHVEVYKQVLEERKN